jgi:hypothetical protein
MRPIPKPADPDGYTEQEVKQIIIDELALPHTTTYEEARRRIRATRLFNPNLTEEELDQHRIALGTYEEHRARERYRQVQDRLGSSRYSAPKPDQGVDPALTASRQVPGRFKQ